MLRLSGNDFALRPISDEDTELLFRIYTSTRTQELLLVQALTEEQKEVFLQQQFRAQHTSYQNNYRGADFYVVEKNKNPIGRLYIHEQFEDGTVRIIDMTILPEWRNKGIGEKLLSDVIKLAQEMDKEVTLRVESLNPAVHLYKRLGFEIVKEVHGLYYLMKWSG